MLGPQNNAYTYNFSGTNVDGTFIFKIPDPSTVVLSPGTDREILRVIFQTDPATPAGTVLPLTFFSDLTTTPPTTNLASASAGTVAAVATTIDGSITLNCPTIEFRRGDANEDGSVSISDAVRILGVLFTAMQAPTCQQTADVNADAAVDLSDPIYLLNALFSGGARES